MRLRAVGIPVPFGRGGRQILSFAQLAVVARRLACITEGATGNGNEFP
jgi:hypothetical protein